MSIRIFPILSIIIGIVVLIPGVMIGLNTVEFLGKAERTQGTVTELIVNDDQMMAPKVQFQGRSGRMIEFQSQFFSEMPPKVGSQVTVLYDPANSNDVMIKSFINLWGPIFTLGLIGGVFFAVGLFILLKTTQHKHRARLLMDHGKRIRVPIDGVEVNDTLELNGQNPFRIVANWRNPADNQLRIFKSENIWFDPLTYIDRDMVDIYIDPKNPRRYYMDLSFLPEAE